MKVTILGYWGAYPHQGEGTTSFLLESGDFHLLLDVGSTTLVQLEKILDPLVLDAVILTHYHHDHIADLGVLQYLRQLKPSAPIAELPIYGHSEDLAHFNALTLPGVSKGIAYQPQKELTIGPFQISFLKTVHPVPCFAMRIVERETGKVLVFTADTGYFADLIPFCQDADVLITDTYFLKGMEGHHAHLTSKETGLLAKEANVKKLVLSHLKQDVDLQELKRQTEEYHHHKIKTHLAQTLMEIEL